MHYAENVVLLLLIRLNQEFLVDPPDISTYDYSRVKQVAMTDMTTFRGTYPQQTVHNYCDILHIR